ncbi:hypothetical protein RG47T_4460 [Mucilaginibacter polytrichastri]|uniref:TM2 domain-containing protein n=2 Tax=Mucilaginibacter polytrichastri TaxID=1302689 RepID=A0A1Q6A4Q2_9SPHI|nr:hypothetical protein RG47T_4460 [Mucilaginibacter polytrichastri]
MFPGVTYEEATFLGQLTTGLSDTQKHNFVTIYGGKRRDPQDIMLVTLLGFVGIAGVQRFLTGQTVMGLIYFFTAGFCFIGTIVDIINYKSLANEFNQKMAYESLEIARMGA